MADALGAFEAGTLIGVANYAMCGKPAIADVAVVVAHENHLCGVGTALLRRLARVARDKGIQHLVADVLASNHVMFKVLHDAPPRDLQNSFDQHKCCQSIDRRCRYEPKRNSRNSF